MDLTKGRKLAIFYKWKGFLANKFCVDLTKVHLISYHKTQPDVTHEYCDTKCKFIARKMWSKYLFSVR